jgi:hypothetical protein
MRAVWTIRGLVAAGVLMITLTQGAQAQRSALREVRNWGSLGGSAALAIPVGEFANHVTAGGGFDAFMAFNLDPSGMTAVRVDGSLLAYGRARDFAWVDDGWYAWPVDITTTSFILSFRAGPQITVGQGPVKLYGFGLAGLSYFATTTSFDSYSCGCSGYDEITEHGDVNFAWEAGGGFLVPLGHRAMLDLGARYVRNGQAQYLPARFVGTGSTLPLESEANLVAVHVGVTFQLH